MSRVKKNPSSMDRYSCQQIFTPLSDQVHDDVSKLRKVQKTMEMKKKKGQAGLCKKREK